MGKLPEINLANLEAMLASMGDAEAAAFRKQLGLDAEEGSETAYEYIPELQIFHNDWLRNAFTGMDSALYQIEEGVFRAEEWDPMIFENKRPVAYYRISKTATTDGEKVSSANEEAFDRQFPPAVRTYANDLIDRVQAIFGQENPASRSPETIRAMRKELQALMEEATHIRSLEDIPAPPTDVAQAA